MPGKATLTALDKRRRELRMSYAAVAKRSHVSMPTVIRILSGTSTKASFANVLAIAECLGMTMRMAPKLPCDALLKKQAEEKARKLVGMVQGTSALEGQGIDAATLERMRRQTVHELLAGSRRRLWSD